MGNIGQVIQIYVGQAGVQIANACWELYCIEYCINTNGCLTRIPEDHSYESLFSLTDTAKVVPRVVMVDSEPTVIDEIRTGCYRHLFHPDTLITGKEDSGSSFARGYHTIGSELIDYTMDNIRKVTESCNNLNGFLLFRAIGGGTGSAIGNLILEHLQSDYGKKTRLEVIIFPSPSLSPLIVEPYNALLTTHTDLDISDCSFIMDNEALYDICTHQLNVSHPTYTNLNRIIAQVVSTFTGSQHHTGSSNLTFGELATNLVPYSRIHFPLVSYAPFCNATKASFKIPTVEDLTNECFQPANQLVQCNPSKGKYMACALLYRGDVSPADANFSINNLRRKSRFRFVDWSPTGFKVSINPLPPSFVRAGDMAKTNRALLTLANNTAIARTWCRMLAKYNLLLSRRAFVHHYISEGMEEATFDEASENVCALIQDYEQLTDADITSIRS